MLKVLFYRRYRSFSGGHLKVWDYFTHVRQSPQHVPHVFFSDDSVWDATNPWVGAAEHRLGSWRTEDADVLFLAGGDWTAITEQVRRRPPVPVINLVQHVRHGDPANRRYRFLEHRAIRICVSQEVADAVAKSGRVNGPLFVIPNGVDSELFSTPTPEDRRDIDILIAGLKQPELAERLRPEIESLAPRVEVLTTRLPRAEFLSRLSRSVVTVFLPNPTEGFYLPALEGMGLGTLVVCPDCAGNRSFCLPGRNSFRPEHRESAILDAVKASLRLSAADRREMLSTARATAFQHSLAAERSAFLAILNNLAQIW